MKQYLIPLALTLMTCGSDPTVDEIAAQCGEKIAEPLRKCLDDVGKQQQATNDAINECNSLRPVKARLNKAEEVLKMIRNDNCERIKYVRDQGYSYTCLDVDSKETWDCTPEVLPPSTITYGGDMFTLSSCTIKCGKAQQTPFNVVLTYLPSPITVADPHTPYILLFEKVGPPQPVSSITALCTQKKLF